MTSEQRTSTDAETCDAPVVESADFLQRLFDDVEFHYPVVVAAHLGIADLLAAGPWSITDLATATGADARSLGRVLRRLASRGLFHAAGDHWEITPLAAQLRSDAPGKMRAQALWIGSEAFRRTWGDLAFSVRTGAPSFDHVYGKPFFDHLGDDPELASVFNDVMTRDSSDEGPVVAAAHDFSRYRRLVDVGGGHGALLAAILERYPTTEGVLFDQPDVIASAHGAIDTHIATGRAETVPGDFLETLPAGADVYMLKWIVHDWDDEAATRILTNCRRGMVPHGRVLIIEYVIPDHAPGPNITSLDTTMLVFTGSRERTLQEYRELLRSAGLTFIKSFPTAGPFSIIEAAPTQS